MLTARAYKLFLVACMSACWTQVAGATDFDVFSVTPPQSQSPNWAGFYLHNNAGASDAAPWANLGGANPFASPGATAPAVSDSFGYNFQSGNFVFGLEGSLSAANFDGRFTSSYFPATGGWSPNMNWLGTVSGRVGYSLGQWLPYVKGGFAAANVGSPTSGLVGFTQSSVDRTGWTAGVGLEYQISSKWSLGLEYLYTDLGAGPSNPVAGAPDVYGTAVKSQSLLGRLNYKAGW